MPDVAKVVDFGLVKEIAPERRRPRRRSLLGTPGVHRARGRDRAGRVGPAADLYALGAVGYFLLTGQRVFEGKTNEELILQHVTRPPRPPSEIGTPTIPAALEALILRCLAKAPSARFASAAALAAALEDVPRTPGWSHAEAQAWWRAFRAAPATPVPADAQTITIDLDHALGARAGISVDRSRRP